MLLFIYLTEIETGGAAALFPELRSDVSEELKAADN
jgi:hypothetical protein